MKRVVLTCFVALVDTLQLISEVRYSIATPIGYVVSASCQRTAAHVRSSCYCLANFPCLDAKLGVSNIQILSCAAAHPYSTKNAGVPEHFWWSTRKNFCFLEHSMRKQTNRCLRRRAVVLGVAIRVASFLHPVCFYHFAVGSHAALFQGGVAWHSFVLLLCSFSIFVASTPQFCMFLSSHLPLLLQVHHKRAAEPPAHQLTKTTNKLSQYYPPASTARDACTIQKFFELTSDVVRVILDGLPPESVDFPMKPSPAEWDIIRANPKIDKSILLRGRSGTGKTTCLVYRLWNNWLTAY